MIPLRTGGFPLDPARNSRGSAVSCPSGVRGEASETLRVSGILSHKISSGPAFTRSSGIDRKIARFVAMVALNFAAKDHTTLAQHPRHMRISRGYYGHFSSGGYPRSSWGFVTLWNAVSSPNLQWGEDPAANDFVHVRDTGTMPLAIKEL